MGQDVLVLFTFWSEILENQTQPTDKQLNCKIEGVLRLRNSCAILSSRCHARMSEVNLHIIIMQLNYVV